jgi:site-specific recombinase XerC
VLWIRAEDPLNRSDIHWERKEAKIVGKGNKERMLFFTDRALSWLERYLSRRWNKVAKRYTESSIRQILGRVMEVPDERIRTSRGALFNWLIQRHGKRLSANDTPPDARP